jgi:threonine dehydrogenase-like Zn-dependent dehydrogenase
MLDLGEEMSGMPEMGRQRPDLGRDVFMGHEFSAEVLELGPDTVGPAPGTVVTSLPILITSTGMRPIVYSNDVAAGYGEEMLLSTPLMVEVPNGLEPRHAALTEPMAVGVHAVSRSSIAPGEGAVVLGCGPVGLAVVAALRLKGIDHIVAADLSAARRATAARLGAHEVVDPRDETAFAAWGRTGGIRTLVVFEAIGVPGILNEILRCSPMFSRVVVVGMCMQPDTVVPFFAIGKELNLQFVLGYDPLEFNATLRHIADGEIPVAPLITGEVDLDGIGGAFEALADPEEHVKILVVP